MKIAVIGVGSAGIMSISHIIPYLSKGSEVVSIYDPNVKILGIGESTNPNFADALEFGAGFQVIDDLEKLEGTLKFGTRYINWRDESWVNPLFSSGHALHFNNFKLKEFTFERFKKLWPNKFKVLEGNVTSVQSTFQTATVVVDGVEHQFDYVVDCRGFPKDYTDYVMSDCSPVNKCFVYSVPPHIKDFAPCTEHIATKHGWTFGIPLTTRHTYGYLFNSNLTSDNDALQDMREVIGVDIQQDDLTVYKFNAFYKKEVFNGRILYNGNSALFFEPLSASSIYCYSMIVDLFTRHLQDPLTYNREFVNNEYNELATSLEDMLSFLYHGGSVYDTEFWQYAKDKASKRLENSVKFKNTIEEYQHNSKNEIPFTGSSWFFSPYSLRLIEEKMGYNYFKG